MILFENTIVKLNYSPATDIVEVEYPDLHDFLLPEIKHSIDILLDNIRSYDIKKVLLDSTRTIISVSADESREVSLYLATGLLLSRVQKVARVQSPSFDVEMMAERNIEHIKEVHPLSFQLQNFVDKAAAIQWLNS